MAPEEGPHPVEGGSSFSNARSYFLVVGPFFVYHGAEVVVVRYSFYRGLCYPTFKAFKRR